MKILDNREFKDAVLFVESSINPKLRSITRGDAYSDVNSAFTMLGSAATIINKNPKAEDRTQAIEKFKELVKGIENKFGFTEDLKSNLDKDKAGLIKVIRGEGKFFGRGPSHFAAKAKLLESRLDEIHELLIEASNQLEQEPHKPKGGF